MSDTTTQTPDTSGPRYPDCHVTLTDSSANAVSIMMKVRRGLERYLRQQGSSTDEIRNITEEFMDEAQSGDYDNVLTTAFRWVDVN